MKILLEKLMFAFQLAGLAVLFAGCVSSPPKAANREPGHITVQGNRFVDDQGRQVVLNGINVVSKSKEEQYMFKGGPEFYANLRKWGFNCIRFIIIWDGLEPEPGVYNEAYLTEIDKRIQWAGENGLFVVLDMHQDLFSVKYSDGAPEWATLDEGKAHETGAIWSDAYLLSSAVQTAFDNFWANIPASDGIGIQDHYANLWKHIAQRYAGNPTVIGYDIMNEPFPGSPALAATPALLTAYGQLIYKLTGKILSEAELGAAWADQENRTQTLKMLASRENYSQVIDTLYALNQVFETGHLQAMYQKVADAIRSVDTSHVLFLEHSYFSNTGVKSSIERTLLPDGSPDPLVAYAPHGYDLVTDTKDAASAASERLDFIFDRIQEKGVHLNMPVWLGEWGAYYNHDTSIVPTARYSMGLIDKHVFGQAYWSYNPGTEDQAYFQQALLRPYSAYINGELLEYGFDYASATFSVEWKESNTSSAPTVIYIPKLKQLDTQQLEALGEVEIVPIEDAEAGWVVIPAYGKGQTRKLVIQL